MSQMITRAAKTNNENLNVRPGKAAVPTAKPLASRPALGDLASKVNRLEVPKNVPLKKAPVQPAAYTKKIAIAVTAKSKEIVIKENKTVKPGNQLKPRVNKPKTETIKAKFEESIISSKSYTQSLIPEISEVNSAERSDPSLVSEYIDEIFQYLMEVEDKYPIRSNYLTRHESTPKMRSILVNWLVEVHLNFKCVIETLHLAVAIVDRYLQANTKVGSPTLQLVGVTAMYIACKYEEIHMPDQSEFIYICDDAFSLQQLLRMEKKILILLQFNLGRPYSLTFLRRYSKILKVSAEQYALGCYLCDIALLDYELCHVQPSLIAAAACCLAISILNDCLNPAENWTDTIASYTHYKYADIKPVLVNLAFDLAKLESSKLKAVQGKFSHKKYGAISKNAKLKGPVVKKLIPKDFRS